MLQVATSVVIGLELFCEDNLISEVLKKMSLVELLFN